MSLPWLTEETRLLIRRRSRGAKGALPTPSPQNIAPPNSQARIQGGQEGIGPPPPYKILDPPMVMKVVEISPVTSCLLEWPNDCAVADPGGGGGGGPGGLDPPFWATM